MVITDDGIDIFSSDVHPEKAETPITTTEGGISICVNDLQSKKA